MSKMIEIPTDAQWTVASLTAALAQFAPGDVISFGRSTKAKAATGTCWCGCGTPTTKKFAPGHDARFHGWAKRAARGEMPIVTDFVSDEARADYMKWFNAEKEAIATKQVLAPAIQVLRPVAAEIKSIEPIEEPADGVDAETLIATMEALGE